MSNTTPLRNTIGNPATGKEHYFERPKVTNKIRNGLDSRQNILISAPRRIGKSSILKHLTATPKENEIIKYLSMQSTSSSDAFFQQLFNLLVKDSEILSYLDSHYTNSSAAVRSFLSGFRSVSLEGGLDWSGENNFCYFSECQKLIKQCNTKKVIILLDEFPDAVNNMIRADKSLAIDFLQKKRELRQTAHDYNLQFIYTGSSGLANVVQQIQREDLINDLKEIKVPPLSETEALDFIEALVLGYKEYQYSSFELDKAVIAHIVNNVKWRIPYYLQIIVERLFDQNEEDNLIITNALVDQTLEGMIKPSSPSYSYFQYWLSRLEKNLGEIDQKVAIEILNKIAVADVLAQDQISALTFTVEPTMPVQQIVNMLIHDGYISEDHQSYGFNSFLLQKWWLENVAS